ncbi:MAG: GNAT family N-acetyltransferase, partial [Granulosicoccus sp.]|nr:GNAT family N-acetyltransferase [Granulosicoccus sp.]
MSLSDGPIQLTIRLAQSADEPLIRQCARSAYSQYVARIGREPAPMVADFESAIAAKQVYAGWAGQSDVAVNFAGYVVFFRRLQNMHLENVAVTSSMAGRGFGRQLIEYVEKQASLQDLAGVELYTNVNMIENLSLYPALGYV